MLHIGIVEDNSVHLSRIQGYVNRTLFSLNLDYKVHTYLDSEQFLNSLNTIAFGMLILDIELPKINGIELSKIVSNVSKDTIVLFLTSYDNYMKEAFGVNVFKYLLKDDDFEISRTLLEAVQYIELRPKATFKTPFGIVTLYLDEIVFIEYIGRNPTIFTITGQTIRLSAGSLSSIYKDLDNASFILVNSQNILNMKHIFSLSSDTVVMKGYERDFRISRSRRKEFREIYEQYLMVGNKR